MNILHTESSEGWGGQEIRIINESLCLLKRGHNVEILCSGGSEIYKKSIAAGIKTTATGIARKNIKNLFSVYKFLSNHRFDLISTHSSTDSWLTSIAAFALTPRPPIIKTRHISAPISVNFFTRWIYKNSFCHTVTTGEKIKEDLIQSLGINEKQISSVPTGINENLFSPTKSKISAKKHNGLDANKTYIGIIATLRSWKGHLYLIKAIELLNNPEIQLIIVGKGPYYKILREYVELHKLAHLVNFIGHSDTPKIWLDCFDIFCLPSYANEGVPQALVQAAMCDIPIITTQAGSISELVSKNLSGFIVPEMNEKKIRDAILEIIEKPQLAKKFSAEARRIATQKFSEEKMTLSMERIYSDCIKRRFQI